MTDAQPALRPYVARAAELARSIRDEIRKVLVSQDAASIRCSWPCSRAATC